MVCVVSLEESNVTPETVPFPQCREIRTEPQAASHMDKIIIAASAAICGTVVIAVVIFICCNRKRSQKNEKLRLNNVLAAGTNGGHHNGISTTATSLAGSQVQSPLANMGNMGLGQLGGSSKDWDQLSMYSSRSIPRARMYHSDRPGNYYNRQVKSSIQFSLRKSPKILKGSVMGSVNGGFIADDARSHVSGYSMNKSANGGVNLLRSRSLIDGPTQRSVSAMSGRGPSYLPPGLHHGMSGAMGHHLSAMGLGPLGMAGMGGSMNAMAGLPTLSGMGLSRAGRNGCSGKASKTTDQNGHNKRHHSKSKTQKSANSTLPTSQTDNATNEALTTSTTTLIPAESLPASSTETLSSTQA